MLRNYDIDVDARDICPNQVRRIRLMPEPRGSQVHTGLLIGSTMVIVCSASERLRIRTAYRSIKGL
jgi:hypothetical protein